MDVLYKCCCGMDVRKDTVAACILIWGSGGGTEAEARLWYNHHVLRARLQGGIRNKARRGDLFVRPPMGFVYSADGKLILDPDHQVQQSVRLLFETFRRTGSAMATVKYFAEQSLPFPK